MLPLTLLVLIIFSSNNKKRVYGLLYGTMLISLMVWYVLQVLRWSKVSLLCSIAYMLVLESAVAIAFLTMLSCLIVAEFIYVSVKLSTSGKPEEVTRIYNTWNYNLTRYPDGIFAQLRVWFLLWSVNGNHRVASLQDLSTERCRRARFCIMRVFDSRLRVSLLCIRTHISHVVRFGGVHCWNVHSGIHNREDNALSQAGRRTRREEVCRNILSARRLYRSWLAPTTP
jgi:hypothetical protein